VQHELTLEEQTTLRRTSATVTSRTGYAGGMRAGDGGKVCYHNAQRTADYGQLGHAEAVQLDLPVAALPQFCERYFGLFGSRGFRHDPQDRGGEYRSVLGLPGGVNSPLYAVVEAAAAKSPMRLVAGRGDEPDTLESKSVLVYDSNRFPFYSAELYHQFHNDFIGPPYGKAYNAINDVQYKAGSLRDTGCPLPPQGWF
jgi:peptide methionine sulfoxide reductase MsrA